jgi:hypothetical protein
METETRKLRKTKYTKELVFEIISYIHEKIESNSFSTEEMSKKYSTTSNNFLSILKKHAVVILHEKYFWIGDKPTLTQAELIAEEYLKSHRAWNQAYKEKKEKLLLHKKHLESIEIAEKVLKSEELELESKNVYKAVVNEKDYNNAIDELSSKASDALVKAEQMYKDALFEIAKLKEANHRIRLENESLRKESHFWKGEYQSLSLTEPVNRELKEEPSVDRTESKKFIKILGIKFYVNQ